MKTAYSLFSFDEKADLTRLLPLIREAGYDGVEPVLGEEGYLTPETPEGEILRLREMAEQNGLVIPSVGVWSLWRNNLVSDRAEIRARAREIVRFQLRAARLLGADTILVVPGYVGTDFVEKPECIRYDIAYDRAREAFRALSVDAEREGVRIGIENVWNRFLLSPLEVARLVDEVASPWFGVYLDVGNVVYTGYPEHWIEILGGRIFKIHLSDYRRSQTGIGAFVDLFAGDTDFAAVTRALGSIGYDDWLTLEMLPNYAHYPELSIQSNRLAVERIVEMCREARRSPPLL